jgi:hypothetical protein
MILIPFEKAPDIIASIAKRGHVLLCFQKGSLRVDRDSLKIADANSGTFGIQKEDGVMIGVADYSQNISHHTMRMHVFFEKSTLENIKVNLVVASEHESLADVLRELGFSPEIRMRQHSFVSGNFASVSEYGCIL